MMVVTVAVAAMAPVLACRRHDGRVQVASAVGGRCPVEERVFRRTRGGGGGGGAQDATLEEPER